MANIQGLDDMTPVLKTVYLPIRKKAFPYATPALAAARRGTSERVTYAGNDLMFNVKTGRRGGFVASARGFLPDAQQATEKQGRLSVARTYATVEVDQFAYKVSENPKGASISLAKKITEDVMDQWKIEQERIIQGDGRGVRALVKTVTDTTHIIVDSPYGIDASGPGNLHLVVGDTIDVLNGTTFARRGKAQITAISLSGDDATLTLSTAVASMAAEDILVTAVPTATNASDNSFGAEPYGFMSFVDVEANFATFEGINDGQWVAQKTTSTTIDETTILDLLLLLESRAGVNVVSDPGSLMLITTPGIWKRYGESLLGLRRFSPPSMTIKGGFKAVDINGAALVRDPWTPRGRLYAIHGKDTLFVDLMDFGLASLQDAPRWKQASKQDAYEATYAAYWNYGVTLRNSHGVISGITDTTNYSPVFA